MKKRDLPFLLAFALALPQSADTFSTSKDKPIATITLPDKWDAGCADNGVKDTSPDEEIDLSVEDNDTDRLEKMFAHLEKKNVKAKADTVKKSDLNLNGTNIVDPASDAKDADGPTHVDLTVFGIGKRQGLLMLCLGDARKVQEAGRADRDPAKHRTDRETQTARAVRPARRRFRPFAFTFAGTR